MLRGKVVRWAAVAVSVVGISIGMGMSAQALNRVKCFEKGYLQITQKSSIGKLPLFAMPTPLPTMCFANAGESKVLIADVERISSGNIAGFIDTNKGMFRFNKKQQIDFGAIGKGRVTITRLKID